MPLSSTGSSREPVPMKAAAQSPALPRSGPGPAAVILALFCLLVAGCATTHELKVDSIAKPKAENAISYEIRNKNPLVADDSLRYKEAANLVKTGLSGRGLYEAPANVKADMVIDLDYGVGAPFPNPSTSPFPAKSAPSGCRSARTPRVAPSTRRSRCRTRPRRNSRVSGSIW